MSEASADKMMVKARGGKVWHRRDKEAGRVPAGLTGLDKEATLQLFKSGRLALRTRDILFDLARQISRWIVYPDAELRIGKQAFG